MTDCPECGAKAGENPNCRTCAMHRQVDALKQMQAHAGPVYEKHRERTRAGTAQWRAAGSPVKVTTIYHADGTCRHVLGASVRRGALVDATPEQIRAWYEYRVRRTVDRFAEMLGDRERALTLCEEGLQEDARRPGSTGWYMLEALARLRGGAAEGFVGEGG